MSRFFALLLFFVIALGLLIHAEYALPKYFDWIGHLPGDLIIKKQGVTLYAPFASSFLISVVCSLLFIR